MTMRLLKAPIPVWFIILSLTVLLAAFLLVVDRDTPNAESYSIADPSKLGFLVNAQGVPAIIFDTDFAADVDDVGALAILNAMADSSEANILGVMINSGDYYAPRAVDTINTYYGRPDIPIGATWDPAVSVTSKYTLALAVDFPNDLGVIPNAVDLYRQILAEQPDRSVTIVSIGFLTNLQGLLASEPDEFSVLGGSELVASKVRELVVMGGQYPDSASHPDGKEYNFAMDAKATYAVIPDWPTPIVFSGYELGVDLVTGAILQEKTPPDNPVRTAYQLYNDGIGRSSWDLTAVYFAVRGLSNTWQLCGPGYNVVYPDGSNRWDPETDRAHYYLRNAIAKAQIKALLDDLLTQPPNRETVP
jgi:inosine-uridine nucleoside N-ribohydrolase